MSFMFGLMLGIYLGIGIVNTVWALANAGLGAGWRLTWRIPAVILFWPGLFIAAIANQ